MGMAVDTGSGKGKRPRAAPSINVTPLVDVILVVLIIFMLVTPMMMKTFWLNVPKTADKQQKDDHEPQCDAKKPLVMTVAKDGTIRVNRHVIPKTELAKRLPRLLAAKDNKVLYFDAADDADYGVAVEAMDISRSGGARSIAILSQPVAK